MKLLNPENVQPFTTWKGDVGCLLIHGFTGSPDEMRELGDRLAEQDLSVMCRLLPGHGQDPAALNKVTWREWVDEVMDAYDEMSGRCRQVFACGLSMGGVLALHLAAHRPLAGVVGLAAFLRPADWRLMFLDLFRHVHPFEAKGTLDIRDPGGRERFAGYDVHPTHGTSQMMRLCRHLKDDLGEVRCPTLLVHGRHDFTVRHDQMDVLSRHLTGARSVDRILLEESGHVLTLDAEKDRIAREVLAFFDGIRHPVPVAATA